LYVHKTGEIFKKGMKKMNFTTVEELLASDGFQKWYQKTDDKEVQVWDEWIAENPEHQRLANEAIQILLLFRSAQENKVAEQEIKAATTRLTDTIRNRNSSYYQSGKKFENRINSLPMIKNYFKIAWRSLLKDKQFTLLNVLGLSAGLACSLLIFLWVSDETSFDRFFANDERLYRLLEGRNNGGEISYGSESSGRLSTAVKQSLPEVEYAAAVAPAKWFSQNTLSVNDRNIKANGQYAEKDFFNIFSFQLIDGNKNSVLATPGSIVLSDELATRLFGNI
jgi:hypothetical protein